MMRTSDTGSGVDSGGAGSIGFIAGYLFDVVK